MNEYLSDKKFIQGLDAALPQNAMVWQMPYMNFPDHFPINRMEEYNQFKGYLYSKSLLFSYGTMRGRKGDFWMTEIAALPLDKMLQRLLQAGYSGIYIDRWGYEDMAKALEAELEKILSAKPVVSEDGRLSFFDIRGLKGK
jgi:phosphoglycerol transferase